MKNGVVTMSMPIVKNKDGTLVCSPAPDVWIAFTHMTDCGYCVDVFDGDALAACVFDETGQELLATYLELDK